MITTTQIRQGQWISFIKEVKRLWREFTCWHSWSVEDLNPPIEPYVVSDDWEGKEEGASPPRPVRLRGDVVVEGMLDAQKLTCVKCGAWKYRGYKTVHGHDRKSADE